jgi:hypothetical protein
MIFEILLKVFIQFVELNESQNRYFHYSDQCCNHRNTWDVELFGIEYASIKIERTETIGFFAISRMSSLKAAVDR